MEKPKPLISLLLRRMHLTGVYSRVQGIDIEVRPVDWATGQHQKAVSRHDLGVKNLRQWGLLSESWGQVDRFWLPALPKSFTLPPLAEVISQMKTGKSPAITELIAYLILRGTCQNYHGNRAWSPELIHTLLCGVAWDKVEDPENDLWAEFAGTFHEAENESMTAVHLHCLCGWTNSHACLLGVEELSIARLLSVVAGEMRDEL
jgi:hypothetical protein